MLFHKPFFYRADFNISLPTGQYDRHESANIGNHYVTIGPYFVATYVLNPRFELSTILYYRWNGMNRSPILDLGATTTQAGQAFHENYDASYEVRNGTGIRIGFNAYRLGQITDHRIDNQALRDSRSRIIGLGPGIQFSNGSVTAVANVYFETGAHNYTEGTRVVLRIYKVLPYKGVRR